jgi:Rieske 2Fe-2S family protein
MRAGCDGAHVTAGAGGLPLADDDLRAATAPLERARMLPSAAYTDPAVLEWERDHLFDGGWVAACHRGAVADPGAQVAVALGRGSALVVRDGDAVRAYANVCRHRGHELLEVGEQACRASVVCPYHAWSYDLDGRLRHATGWAPPSSWTFDPDELALAPLSVAEHLGWVFVNASGDAPPVTAAFAGLDDVLGPHDAGSLASVARRDYDVAANWKVIHENYQECLHCTRIHPELCRVSPPDSGDNLAPGDAWVGGWMDLADDAATMSMDGSPVGAPLPGLDDRIRRRVAYVALLPSLLVSAHPDYVLTHRLEPLEPGRTKVTCEWLAPAGAALDEAIALWDVTNLQDWAACESVQRGLGSGRAVPGPLAPREDAVHGVVQWFARRYLEHGAGTT